MGQNSKIEWTTHTFNPWRGCSKVAAGCAHCYAERDSKRNSKLLGIWGDQGTRVLASDEMWREPVKWNEAAAKAGERHRVFCASFADVFEDYGRYLYDHHGDELIADEEPPAAGFTMNDARRRLFRLIDMTPNLDWLLLTKRPQNIRRMWCSHVNTDGMPPSKLHRKNVWLGTSIATQLDADKNIPELLKCRDLSPVLFLSAEPLLGPVDVVPFLGGHSYHCDKCNDWKRTEAEMVYTGGGCHSCVKCGTYCPAGPTIDWIIAGGESGPKADPMNPAWPRSLRDQCQAAGVPFFFKQWGEWGAVHQPIGGAADQAINGKIDCRYGEWHDDGVFVESCLCGAGHGTVARVGKKLAGRMLDGREWSEFPVVR